MTTADDDRDDPQLDELRAVWRSMRDEEPSDRGLAALMSAARVQAEQMKPRESWWQRVLAVFRRPPVLALASVAVLLGGALVLTQRKDELQQVSTVSAVDDEAAGSAAATGAAVTEAPAAGRLRLSQEPASVAAPATGGEPLTKEERGELQVAAPEDPPAKPRPRRTAASHDGATADLRPAPVTTATRDDLESSRGYASPPPPAPDPAPAPEAEKAPSSPGGGGTLAGAGVDRPVEAPRKDSVQRRSPPPIDGDDAGALRSSPAPATLSQLVKQCESAAERGDCAKVRSVAKQIAARDGATYKQLAAKPAIRRCLLAE